jgi:spermidine/putrescine-binding protein
MGICHSKKTKKAPQQLADRIEVPPTNPNQQQTSNIQPKQKEEDVKKKYDENDNIDNNAEIMDENIHQVNMKNVNREFLPNQVYTQHLTSIMRGLQDNKSSNEFKQTTPIPMEEGLYSMETYGSYGKKSS